MIDNKEINELLAKLEELEDEELAVELLREFNLASKIVGKLVLNLDKTLSHEEWKRQSDEAAAKLESIIVKIRSL